MSELDDHDLLADYARDHSEAAFAELVSRHVNLVYSVAWRVAGNVHAAQEITQAVFIILAHKAGRISRNTIVSGWLHQTARLTADNYLRGEFRRQKREQEAYMQSTLNEPEAEVWPRIEALLDEALARLGERDRNAIMLRFFENKSLREVGQAMGAGEDAAKMRVNRALDKLRKIFTRRGVTFSAAAIAGALAVRSVQAAPTGLAQSATTVALAKGGAATTSTLTLVRGALKIMAWTKAKTAIVVAAGVLVATGTTTIVVEATAHPRLSATDLSWADHLRYWELDSRALERVPAGVSIFRPTRFPNTGGSVFVGSRMMAKDYSVNDLIDAAYGFSYARTLFPPDLPAEHYDLMLTLLNGSREWLQEELKSRFGLTAHREKRNQDVLLLTVKNPNPPNLKRHGPGDNNGSWTGGNRKAVIKNQDLGGFLSFIESTMGQPVFNRTGLNGRYDVELDWQPQPGESDKEAFRRALLEQLGLELVPSSETVEMLVVEKVK